MSIFDTISRYGAAFAQARRDRNTARIMRSLPPDIQKDVGWPSPTHTVEQSALRSLMSAR